MNDKGSGAENLIWLAKRQAGRVDPASLQADDILAALTERIAELEARVSNVLAELDPEPKTEPRGEADARVQTDAELNRASEERRTLANEMRLLREAIQGARQDQPPATDVRGTVADEMRSLLSELLADFRSRAPAPPPVEQVQTKSETVAAARTVEIVVEEQRTAPVVDVVATEPAPIVEAIEEPVTTTIDAPVDVVEIAEMPAELAPMVEDVDVLVRPEAIIHEAEELLPAETASANETVDVEPAAQVTDVPVVDEPLLGPAEAVPPIVEDYVEPPVWPDVTPTIERFDVDAALATPVEPTADEVAEVPQPETPLAPEWIEMPEPSETVELSGAAAQEVEPEELTQQPTVVDARLAALWDAALPAEPETMPMPEPQPPAFITEELITEVPPLEVPDIPVEQYPPQELAPEQTIDYVAPPSIEFTVPAIEQLESTQSFSSLFPELTSADPKGLHEIQVVISPIHSFPRLIETERRIRALSTVNALHLRDFRNGVATLTVSVGEAISPAEFGAVIQMLESLHLRLEGTTQTGVELRAEDEPPTE